MAEQQHPVADASSALPPDWKEITDPASGNLYYANLVTGETSWNPPPSPPIEQDHQEQLPSTTTATTTIATTSSVPATSVGGLLLLVPTVRTMIEAEQYHQRSVVPSIELSGLSAGQIADLCILQQQRYQTDYDQELDPYTPIQPFKMDERERRPPMESARLEVRMHALYEQLRQSQR
jgi:hypothetical protein